jgi:WD repeat-containing protein 48
MSFGSRKPKGVPAEMPKPIVSDEKVDESDASNVTDNQDGGHTLMEDSLYGLVQTIRNSYVRQLRDSPSVPLAIGIVPSLPSETPVLKLPANTTVIIQEDRPDTGGVADLYRGTVACVGKDVDIIEKAAPRWLGNLLLWVSLSMS